MTAPGDSTLLLTLLAAFIASTGYAGGRIHQWYRMGRDRDEAYRDGYDTATRSVFSMAARVLSPRRADRSAIRASAAVVLPVSSIVPTPAPASSERASSAVASPDGSSAASPVASPVASLAAKRSGVGMGAAGSSAVQVLGGSPCGDVQHGASHPSATPVGVAARGSASGGTSVPGSMPGVAAAPDGVPGAADAAPGGSFPSVARSGNVPSAFRSFSSPNSGSTADPSRSYLSPPAALSTGAPELDESLDDFAPATVSHFPESGSSLTTWPTSTPSSDALSAPVPDSRVRTTGVEPARPDDEPAESTGRHTVPDELVRAATYRLAPDRVARAKVPGSVPATDQPPADRPARAAVPKPRTS